MYKWQYIETAPKKGTVVDLWCRAHNGRDARMTDMWWTDTTGWRNGENCPYAKSMALRATHWMPLPAPPEAG